MMMVAGGSRGPRPRPGPPGSSSLLKRSNVELAIISFLVGLIVLRGLLLLNGTSVTDLMHHEDEELSPRHSDGSHHAGSSKGRGTGGSKGSSLGKRSSKSVKPEAGKHGRGGALSAGAPPKLFSDMSETDLSGGEAGRLRGGAKQAEHSSQQLIIGAVEHASSIHSVGKRGKRGSGSRVPPREGEQQVVALLAEDSGFDPAVQDDGGEEAETAEWSNAAARKRKGHGEEAAGDEDRWADGGGEEGEGEEEEEEPSGEGRPLPEDGGDGDAGDIDPAAAKRMQQRMERSEARKARSEARREKNEEKLSKLEEARQEEERKVQEEKDQLGADLFANLEKITNKNKANQQMPGVLPGQSQISKQERAQLTDGKAKRTVVNNMRGGGGSWGGSSGRRPLVAVR